MYQLLNGVETSAVVYGTDNKEALSVTACRDKNRITVTLHTQGSCTIRLVNVTASEVSGGSFTTDGNDTVITQPSGKIVVTL